MSCRTRLFLPYLLLPPSPNFCKWKLHSEGILFDYPPYFTLHILSIGTLCQLLVGNTPIQLELRDAPLPHPKAPWPLTWTSCKILHAFALVSLWFAPTEQPEWAFDISQTMHCSLQVSKWFPISLSQIRTFTTAPYSAARPYMICCSFLSDLIHHSSPTPSSFLSCFNYTALSFLPPYNHLQEHKLRENVLQIIASSEPRAAPSIHTFIGRIDWINNESLLFHSNCYTLSVTPKAYAMSNLQWRLWRQAFESLLCRWGGWEDCISCPRSHSWKVAALRF